MRIAVVAWVFAFAVVIGGTTTTTTSLSFLAIVIPIAIPNTHPPPPQHDPTRHDTAMGGWALFSFLLLPTPCRRYYR